MGSSTPRRPIKLQSTLVAGQVEVADLMENRRVFLCLFSNVPNETRFVLAPKTPAQKVLKAFNRQRDFDPSILTADLPQIRSDVTSIPSGLINGPGGLSTIPANGASVTPETSTNGHSNSAALYSFDWNLNTPPKVPDHNTLFEIGGIAGRTVEMGSRKIFVLNEGLKKPGEQLVSSGACGRDRVHSSPAGAGRALRVDIDRP